MHTINKGGNISCFLSLHFGILFINCIFFSFVTFFDLFGQELKPGYRTAKADMFVPCIYLYGFKKKN